MAGLYLHIPFCRQACHYCDFHFSTSLKLKEDLIKCMLSEIDANKSYLDGEAIETIYFGGGTPSLLSKNELSDILDKIAGKFKVSDNAEITLEANPDDLSKSKLKDLKSIGINRLSIGIQSFRDEDLKLMNRAHDSKLAHQSINSSREAGFENINVDLIYGIPGLSESEWRQNVEVYLNYKIPHLSAYNLTFEDKTAFGHWKKIGKISPSSDEDIISQFQLLMKMMEAQNYMHYEISNFALENYISRHNSAYWSGVKYLGIGPSAHSFNGKTRKWNISNNALYIKAIKDNTGVFEEEILSENDHFNEYILTSLRTQWGCDLDFVQKQFGANYTDTLLLGMLPYLENNELRKENNKLFLTEKGKFVADKIASDLFVI